MHIAVYHNLPSGGAKRTLYEQVRRLSAAHEIDVYSLSSADHGFLDLAPFVRKQEIFQFNPLPVFGSPFGRLNPLVRMLNLMRLDRLQQRMAELIAKYHYDLVFVHPCLFQNSPSLLRHINNAPKLYYCQEPLRLLYEPMPARPYDREESGRRKFLNKIDALPAIYGKYLRWLDQTNTRSAHRVLVNSRFIQEKFHKIYGIPAHVSYHGIDTSFFRPLDLLRQDFLLSVGSLTPLKGFDFLIEALSFLASGSRPPLVIASNFQNPPELQYLESLARQMGVDVAFQARISDDRLVELYNQARITLYTPIREPFGLVPLESMACATPVIGIQEGGIPETIIDHQNGLVVQRDARIFSQAILEILSQPSIAQALGKAGREHVENHWTWETAITSLEFHFKAVVQPAQ